MMMKTRVQFVPALLVLLSASLAGAQEPETLDSLERGYPKRLVFKIAEFDRVTHSEDGLSSVIAGRTEAGDKFKFKAEWGAGSEAASYVDRWIAKPKPEHGPYVLAGSVVSTSPLTVKIDTATPRGRDFKAPVQNIFGTHSARPPGPATAELVAVASNESIDGRERVKALRTIKSLGATEAEAVPALMELLESDDYGIRSTTVDALGAIGKAASPSVPALIGILTGDENPAIRSFAASALGRIGPAAREAIPVLIRTLQDRSGEDGSKTDRMFCHGIRRQCAWALGCMGTHADAAAPALTRIVEDPSERASVRRQAEKALESICPAMVLCIVPSGDFQPESGAELLREFNRQMPFSVGPRGFLCKPKSGEFVGWVVVKTNEQKDIAKRTLRDSSRLECRQVEALTPEMARVMEANWRESQKQGITSTSGHISSEREKEDRDDE